MKIATYKHHATAEAFMAACAKRWPEKTLFVCAAPDQSFRWAVAFERPITGRTATLTRLRGWRRENQQSSPQILEPAQ